jgi:hypothetical protein
MRTYKRERQWELKVFMRGFPTETQFSSWQTLLLYGTDTYMYVYIYIVYVLS